MEAELRVLGAFIFVALGLFCLLNATTTAAFLNREGFGRGSLGTVLKWNSTEIRTKAVKVVGAFLLLLAIVVLFAPGKGN